MGAEAAIIGGAVSGGLGLMAANAESRAINKAIAAGNQQYAQTREDLAPWREVGAAANYELAALSGLPVSYPTAPGGAAPAPQQPNPFTGPGNNLFPGMPGSGRSGAPGVIDEQGNPVQANYRSPQQQPNNLYAMQGRGGDTEVAHVTPGEVVVPREVVEQPQVRDALYTGFQMAGADPNRYVVGSRRNSVNPVTGAREFYSPPDNDMDGGGNYHEANPRDPYGDDRRDPFRPAPQPAPAPGPTLPDDYYTQDAAIERFYDSPEYRIAFDEGTKAIEASAAARGGLFGGNTGVALTKYGQDYAANQYGNYWNHLFGLSGSGANAAAQTGQFGMQAANGYWNAVPYAGNQYVGLNNALVGGMSNYYYAQGR